LKKGNISNPLDMVRVSRRLRRLDTLYLYGGITAKMMEGVGDPAGLLEKEAAVGRVAVYVATNGNAILT